MQSPATNSVTTPSQPVNHFSLEDLQTLLFKGKSRLAQIVGGIAEKQRARSPQWTVPTDAVVDYLAIEGSRHGVNPIKAKRYTTSKRIKKDKGYGPVPAIDLPKTEIRFNSVTPEDHGWAMGQKAFARSQTMPRLLKNFCPDCREIVVNEMNEPVRETRGVYLPVEHCCNSVHRLEEGELIAIMTVAEFDAENAAKKEREIQTAKESRSKRQELMGCVPGEEVMFESFRSVVWRQHYSPMAKLMKLCASVHEMLKSEESDDIWEAIDEMSYKEACRYLLTHMRWMVEKRIAGKPRHGAEGNDPLPNYPEARSFEDIVLESRTFPN